MPVPQPNRDCPGNNSRPLGSLRARNGATLRACAAAGAGFDRPCARFPSPMEQGIRGDRHGGNGDPSSPGKSRYRNSPAFSRRPRQNSRKVERMARSVSTIASRDRNQTIGRRGSSVPADWPLALWGIGAASVTISSPTVKRPIARSPM